MAQEQKSLNESNFFLSLWFHCINNQVLGVMYTLANTFDRNCACFCFSLLMTYTSQFSVLSRLIKKKRTAEILSAIDNFRNRYCYRCHVQYVERAFINWKHTLTARHSISYTLHIFRLPRTLNTHFFNLMDFQARRGRRGETNFSPASRKIVNERDFTKFLLMPWAGDRRSYTRRQEGTKGKLTVSCSF